MSTTTTSSASPARIEVIGAGVGGLCAATLFAERGCEVHLIAASEGPDNACCSWWAGGMLAPWCELENSEPRVAELGSEAADFWIQRTTGVQSQGSLVLVGRRDRPDLEQFAARTRHYERAGAERIAALEQDLAGRFDHALHFASESHLDPRQAMHDLYSSLEANPRVHITRRKLSDKELDKPGKGIDWRIDCRGLAARDTFAELRGVKGEMLLLRQPELTLSRPVRLLHPRYPIYIVPRKDHVFMIGATMIESDACAYASARSLMELLNAAWALHPMFGDADVLEIGTDARPAWPDNVPRLRRRGRIAYLNGLFRHGFLCAPALARQAAEAVLDEHHNDELIDEDPA